MDGRGKRFTAVFRFTPDDFADLERIDGAIP